MRRKHERKAGGSDTGSQTCRWGQQHQEVPFLPRVPRRPRRQCCSGSPGRHDIASWPKTCWLAPVSNHVISDYRILDDFGSWSAKGLCNSWTEHTTMLSQLLTAALSSVPYFLQAVAVSPPDARSYQMDPHGASLDKSVSAKLKSCSTSNHGDSASASGLHHGIHQLLP